MYFSINIRNITYYNITMIRMRNDTTKHQTEVPYHSKELKKGLEQAILKQAGLK